MRRAVRALLRRNHIEVSVLLTSLKVSNPAAIEGIIGTPPESSESN
jgi:hypothetical protein